VTEVPSKVTVGTEMDNDAVTSYITKQPINVWAGLSDKYGNLVAVDQNVNVTFTATAGTLSPTKALILNGASKSANVSYTCVSTYGSYAMITGALTLPSGSKWAGTYSGNSRQLATSTFAATISVVTDKTSVKAGTQATITLTLAIAQKNVPVTFAISDATTGYTGTLTVLSAVTDDTGKATTKLNVDVIAARKAKVKATVSKPLSTKITNTIENKTAEITTIAADPAKLIVKTFEHGTTTARSITVPGGVLDIVVSLADAYDNVASNTFAGDIQVGLSATAGALSVTTAYIKKDAFDTSTWGTILFTAPSVTGTVTITATTTQANVAQGSTTVTVAGPEPVVTITDPATDTEIASDVAVTRYIAGNVQVSPAQPSGTAISLIKYSLDGAANVTTPITKVEAGKYYFNFSVSLTPNATHTVIVYATDTAGKTGLATRVIKIVPYLPPGTGTFTPSAPKLLDSAGAVVTSVARNTAFYVQITLKSNSASNLSPYVLAQIKDATGRVVAIGLSQPDVAAGATKNVAVPFLGIATPGTYTVTIFVWSSITDPVAWAPTTTFTIVVT